MVERLLNIRIYKVELDGAREGERDQLKERLLNRSLSFQGNERRVRKKCDWKMIAGEGGGDFMN